MATAEGDATGAVETTSALVGAVETPVVAPAAAIETPAVASVAAVETPVLDQAPAEVAAVEATSVDPMQIDVVARSDALASESAKEKATKKKASRSRKPAVHPPYLEMINEALTLLDERTGSSQYAISKLIEEKHKAHLPANFKKLLLIQLRRFTAAGKLTKVKNSYKISSAAKKPPTVSRKPKSTAASIAKPNSVTGKLKNITAKRKLKTGAGSAKPDTVLSKQKPKSAVAPGKPKRNNTDSKRKKATMEPKRKSATQRKSAKPKTARRPDKAAKASSKAAPGAKKSVAQEPKKYRMKKRMLYQCENEKGRMLYQCENEKGLKDSLVTHLDLMLRTDALSVL